MYTSVMNKWQLVLSYLFYDQTYMIYVRSKCNTIIVNVKLHCMKTR